MLDEKDFEAIDVAFSFVAAFSNQTTVYSKEPLLVALHITHAAVLNQISRNLSPLYYSSSHGIPISDNIEN